MCHSHNFEMIKKYSNDDNFLFTVKPLHDPAIYE